MKLIVSCDAIKLLGSGYRLHGFDRLHWRSVIFYRHFGMPITVEEGFRLFALAPKNIVI